MMGIFDFLFGKKKSTGSANISKISSEEKRKPGQLSTQLISLGFDYDKIRFFAFGKDNSFKKYHLKQIPKKDGSYRQLEAPCPPLKEVQRQILDKILYKNQVSNEAHGFVPNKSIATNAQVHTNADLVINIDLKNFFPSISIKRVIKAFNSLGFYKLDAAILSRVCTYEDRLPQGAPTSPSLSNYICRRLDARINGLAKKHNFNFTRYADDITISGAKDIVRFLPFIKTIIASEGFEIAKHKTKIMRRGSRQKVTGLVVNDKISVPRPTRKLLRAILHKCKVNGPESITDNTETLKNMLKGYASFINITDPEKANRMISEIHEVFSK